MKISDLKFGDKFKFIQGVDLSIYIDTKNHLSQYVYRDYVEDGKLACVPPDTEVSPVGSVEQDKKLVWINSSERAPTLNDCSNGHSIYVLDSNNKVRQTIFNNIHDWVDLSQPYLWAPINKAPALPEPVYKLVKAEFPRDWNKVVYSDNRTKLGTLIGFDKNTLAKYIVKRCVMTLPVNYNNVYTLEKL